MRIDPFKLISFDSNTWESQRISQQLTNIEAPNKVEKTAEIMEFLHNKIASGTARMDKDPGLYALNISDETKNVTSIIGSINYDEKNILFPNEDVDINKMNKYREIFKQYKIQINPVLTFYKNGPSVESLTRLTMLNVRPKIETNINGVSYKLWAIKNPIELDNIRLQLADINRVYIADGHHRFSIFRMVSRKTSAKIMISLMDAESICLKSCHRVVVGPIDPNWMQKLSPYCIIDKIVEPVYDKESIVLHFRDGSAYRILFRPEVIITTSMYSAINNVILKEAFRVKEKERIYPLPGTINFSDIPKIFDLYKHSSVIAFMPELDISDFFKVVDNGHKLPPTSTWFEPKIVDGFLISHFG